MRKLLLLAGIFTVLAYNAQARYYEEDGYYNEEQPRYEQRRVRYRDEPQYERQVRYREEPRYTRQSPQYRRISREEEREYNERRYIEDNQNTVRPYIGLDVATTKLSIGDLEYKYAREGIDDYFEDSTKSFSGVVGVKVNRYFGLEAFYQKSGEEEKDTERKGFVDDIAVVSDETSKISYKAYGVDAIGYIPANQDFEILASLGLAQYDFQTSAVAEAAATDGYNIVSGTFNNKQDFDSLGIRLGIGAQYNITEHFALRGMVRYVKLTDDEYVKSLTEFSLGLRYMF